MMLVRARISYLLVLAVAFGVLQEAMSPVPAGFYLCRNLLLIPIAFFRHLFVWRRPVTWLGLFSFSAACEILISFFLRSQISEFGSVGALLKLDFYYSSPWVAHLGTTFVFFLSFLTIAYFFYIQKTTIYTWIYKFKRRTKQFRFAKEMA
jgi:hypothetical protein